MSPRAVEHIQEAKLYFADAAKEGQEVGFTVLGVLMLASAGSEFADHVLREGPLKESVVNGVENGGNILAATIGIAGLAAVASWGSKAIYHRLRAWHINLGEDESQEETNAPVGAWSTYSAAATF